jgi:hypothetical protein
MGNDSDEYLTRDPEDNQCQNLLGTEIANGERRLNELGVTIEHFQFLKTALVTRFPEAADSNSTAATANRAVRMGGRGEVG